MPAATVRFLAVQVTGIGISVLIPPAVVAVQVVIEPWDGKKMYAVPFPVPTVPPQVAQKKPPATVPLSLTLPFPSDASRFPAGAVANDAAAVA